VKIYVSGPIAGRPEANRPMFEEYAHLVRMAGGDPVLPHDISPEHSGACPTDPLRGADGHSWSCHLRADIVQMLGCDGVVMMPGWERSHGARQEHNTAAACGMPIHYFMGDSGLAKDSQGYPLQQIIEDKVLAR
jgi:hypothetical protein